MKWIQRIVADYAYQKYLKSLQSVAKFFKIVSHIRNVFSRLSLIISRNIYDSYNLWKFVEFAVKFYFIL